MKQLGIGLLWLNLLSVAALAAGASAVFQDTWPQWRGPTRDGQFSGPNWPSQLDEASLTPLWRVDLGPSYSGPIVSSNRVFVTESRDRRWEIVTALDRATGRGLWTNEWEGAISVPFFAKSNGDWIRATPALDGDRLYVAGMRDVLVCLDATTGNPLWRVDFVKELKTPLPDFGFVSSPLVDGDAVYVQAGASVLKLDKATGRIHWRALTDGGGMWGSAFSSPTIATLAGQRQLVVQTRQKLAGLSLTDGAVLWWQPVEAFRGMNILTPVVYGDGVLTSAYGGKTIFFAITLANGQFQAVPQWVDKVQGYMSTPVVIGGHAYQHTRNQRFRCLRLKDGLETWMTDHGFGKYWSLVAQDDRILALDERGILYLVRANPERFELLAERKISDADTWAHLAVADRDLFIRERQALAVFRWKSSP